MSTERLPIDSNSKTLQITPAKVPLKVTYDTTISSETEITLQSGTTIVEISALNAPICMRYKTVAGGTAVSVATDGYHELIQPGITRHYDIKDINNASGPITVLAFIEQSASATLSVIEK